MRDFEIRNAHELMKGNPEDKDSVVAGSIAPQRESVDIRHSHASYTQTASSAPTWVSRRGAGSVRLPSDHLKLGGGTITKSEYDRLFEKSERST